MEAAVIGFVAGIVGAISYTVGYCKASHKYQILLLQENERFNKVLTDLNRQLGSK